MTNGGSAVALYLLGLLLTLSQQSPLEVPDCKPLRDCKCQITGQIFGISCDNLTNFVDFRQKIDDIFEVNETFEIVLQNTVSLPARAIERFIVYVLYIDGTLAEVSDRVFEGVYRIRKFHVINSVLRKIPDFSLVPHSLRSVKIDNSLLSEVGEEFRNLPLLKHLSLRNNSISMVTEDAFRGSNIIRMLDLSYNRLVSLPKSLLDELENLRKLDLSHNQLITLDGNLNYNNPKFLLLSHNNLTNVDNVLHHNMTSMISLYLDHNPLGKITNATFSRKMPSLRFLFLDHTNLTAFDVDNFRFMPNIAILDLSGNHITEIRTQEFKFWKDFHVVFNDNDIETFEGVITSDVKRVFLANNRLTLLDNIFQFTQLTDIDVSRNRLISIEERNFRGVHGTENLALRSNLIERIDREAFTSVRNDLHTLDLSDNRLKNLNGSVKFLSELKSLNVSYNHLDVFSNIEFVGLNELTELYIQHNRILVLTGELQKMPQLQFLNLQRNLVKTLDPDEIPQSLEYLHIKGNPIECDCRIQPFLLPTETHQPVEMDIELCQWLEEPPASLSCPDPCLCSCTHDVNGSYVSMDCSSRHLMNIPPFSNSSSPSHHFFVKISTSQFLISDQVLAMDFHNNNISTLKDIPFPSNLKKLYLANNLLNSLPQSVMQLSKLHRITLANNPWTCDCSTSETRKWMLSKMEGIVDVNNTKCHSQQGLSSLNDRVLVALSDVDLCPSEVGLYIAIAFGLLTFLLLCAAFKITYTRYEMNIKVWLYSHGVEWVKEKDTDQDKAFDAFVSFSHKDEDFVMNDLVAEIENRSSSVRLCLHYRHFLPGEFIHENIMNAVKCSKRTVLVLSRNFLESEWCLMEFRTAHLQALEDRVHRIIVIKMPNLPEEMDPAIKVYLDSTTYVTWGEKYFWQKLMYALPTTEESKETITNTSESIM